MTYSVQIMVLMALKSQKNLNASGTNAPNFREKHYILAFFMLKLRHEIRNLTMDFAKSILWRCCIKGSQSAQDGEDEPEVIDH